MAYVSFRDVKNTASKPVEINSEFISELVEIRRDEWYSNSYGTVTCTNIFMQSGNSYQIRASIKEFKQMIKEAEIKEGEENIKNAEKSSEREL